MLNSVMEYQLPKIQAAELLGISERQLRRVLAAYRRDGAAALAHGNRGRKPRNSVPEDVAGAAVVLASGKSAGFNHSHHFPHPSITTTVQGGMADDARRAARRLV